MFGQRRTDRVREKIFKPKFTRFVDGFDLVAKNQTSGWCQCKLILILIFGHFLGLCSSLLAISYIVFSYYISDLGAATMVK